MSNLIYDYQQQNCSKTLTDALLEYNKQQKHLNSNSGSDELSRLFYCHDITHVLFGTQPFVLRDETITDIWTLAGTDVTFKQYSVFLTKIGYKTVMKPYIKRYGSHWGVYKEIIKIIPDCWKTYRRARRMTKRWPWANPEPMLNRTLAELREEFGVVVLDGT